MCRLLAVHSSSLFSPAVFLKKFALISKNSSEYQGHGWGCAYLENGQWRIYKNISPVWEDDLEQFPQTTLLLGHARSAFRDEGIVIENNMPFYDERYVFIFNGELQGVRIKSEGRIGAEKIFNFIKRFDKGDINAAIRKAVRIMQMRTDFIRAMNLIISDKKRIYLNSLFMDAVDYFTMFLKRENDRLLICSDPFPQESNWQKIKNKTIEEFA